MNMQINTLKLYFELGSYGNVVIALCGREGQGFCEDFRNAFVLKRVTMGRGCQELSKIV